MPKPSSIPTWATDPGARVDPGAARNATGFLPGKKLPAKWLNWVLGGYGGWLQYLRDLHLEPEFLNKAYSWTGLHRFAQGFIANNWGVRDEVLYVNDQGAPTPKQRAVRIPMTSFVPDCTVVADQLQHFIPTWRLVTQPDEGGDAGWRHHPSYPYAGLSVEFDPPFGSVFVRATAQVEGLGDSLVRMAVGLSYLEADHWRMFSAEVETAYPLVGVAALEVNASNFWISGPPTFGSIGRMWVRLTATGPTNVHWVKAEFTDPGPRNF